MGSPRTPSSGLCLSPPPPQGASPPRAITWCRSTCCYCGCAGASPRAVGESMDKGGGQAAGRGPPPPPSRAQGPHLGGAGQELLLLPGRCHRGDEAQRGQVLPFLLEKKRKVVNSTTRGHSLPHLKAVQSCLLPLGENPDSVVHRALRDPICLILSPPLSLACWASASPTACSLCPPGPLLFPLPGMVDTALCSAGPFMPFR